MHCSYKVRFTPDSLADYTDHIKVRGGGGRREKERGGRERGRERKRGEDGGRGGREGEGDREREGDRDT